MAIVRVDVRVSEYNAENYMSYVEMIQSEYDGIIPSDYEHWVAWNEAMDKIQADENLQRILANPMMADDYNPETGECDGVKYWERNV